MSSRERQLQEWRDLKRQSSAKVPLGTSNTNTSSLLARTTKAGIKGPAQSSSLLPKPRRQGSEDLPEHKEAQLALDAPPDSAPNAAQTSAKPSLSIPNFMSATHSSKQHALPGDAAPTSGASSGRRSRPDSARKPAVSASQLQHMESQFTQLAGRLDSLKRESMRASISGSSNVTDDSMVEQVLAPLTAGQAQPARGSRPCPPLVQQPVQPTLAARLEALKRDSMQVCRDTQRVPLGMSPSNSVSQALGCQLPFDRAALHEPGAFPEHSAASDWMQQACGLQSSSMPPVPRRPAGHLNALPDPMVPASAWLPLQVGEHGGWAQQGTPHFEPAGHFETRGLASHAQELFGDAAFKELCDRGMNFTLQRTKDGATAESRIQELAGARTVSRSFARSCAAADSSAEVLQPAVLHQAVLHVSHIRLSIDQAVLHRFVLHTCCMRLPVERMGACVAVQAADWCPLAGPGRSLGPLADKRSWSSCWHPTDAHDCWVWCIPGSPLLVRVSCGSHCCWLQASKRAAVHP